MTRLSDIISRDEWTREDLAYAVGLEEGDPERELLCEAAHRVKAEKVGCVSYYRGLIEFSNICVKNCLYCGIRKSHSSVHRFESTLDEILGIAKWTYENHYGSVVLQSGERTDPKFIDFVEEALRGIKRVTDGKLGITLCVGEQTEETYRRWFEAGAHLYLLRIEESNPDLYSTLHPADGHHLWSVRDACLRTLKRIGYQVGTGVMIGLPGQTAENLADDILYFKALGIDMIGMGPYIVSRGTPLGDRVEAEGGNTDAACRRRFILGLNMIAATRLALKDVNIAATTALQGLDKRGRELGLKAGANILMPIVTLPEHRADYQLYDGKPCIEDTSDQCKRCLTGRVRWAGDTVGFDSWGDSRHYFGERGIHPVPRVEAGEGAVGAGIRAVIPICSEGPDGPESDACHFTEEN